MTIQKISPTRMELLAHKNQIALARKGRELLEQKRMVLMKEFLRVVDVVLERSDMLQQTAASARNALGRAQALAGVEAVRSAALAMRGELPLQVDTVSVMGVRVPQIEQRSVSRLALAREYAPTGTSVAIDEAAAAFEAEVDAIIQLSESELRLTRLAQEIQRTSRRLNVLDHLLIPRLEAERDFIQMMLDERERTDHFRLKLIKHSLERRRQGESGEG
jgi:V/A-type H+-transporting ATPase subunit D